jgi:hypothetical protein
LRYQDPLVGNPNHWSLVDDGNMAVAIANPPYWDNNVNPPIMQPTPLQNPAWPIRITEPNGAAHDAAYDGSGYDSIDTTGLRFIPNAFYTLESQEYSNYGNFTATSPSMLYGTVIEPDGTSIATSTNPLCPTPGLGGYWGEADINCESPLRKDSNGNSIAFSQSTGWTDTAGRNIPLPTSVPISQCPSGPQPIVYALQWNFPGFNGGSYPVLICYSNVGVFTPPGSTSGWETLYPVYADQLFPSDGSLIQSVVLPGSATWTFTYATDALYPGSECSRVAPAPFLSGITYPTGATTTFEYSWNCGGGILSQKTENANDGTGPHVWTYTSTATAGNPPTYINVAWTVTDPLQNDTVYSTTPVVVESSSGTIQPAISPLTTRVDWYQGTGSSRTILKSQVMSYVSTGQYIVPYGTALTGGCAVGSCQGRVAMNTLLTSKQTILPNGLTSEVDYGYDSPPICLYNSSGSSCAPLTFGRILTESEYDFGQGAKGALLHSTSYTYQDQVNSNYFGAHILNDIQSEQVTNGSGTTLSSKSYGYDENNGSPQGTYGNQTSVSRIRHDALLRMSLNLKEQLC